MDIRDLKKLLEPQQSYDTDVIRQLLKARTQGTLDRLRRNVMLELMLMVAFTIVLILWGRNIAVMHYFWIQLILAVIISFSFVMYSLMLHSLKQSKLAGGPVREALRKTVRLIRLFVHSTNYSAGILSFIVTMLAAWFEISRNHAHVLDDPQALTDTTIKITAMCLAYGAIAYFLTRLWNQRIYGRHLKKLQQDLNELEHAENDTPHPPPAATAHDTDGPGV